MDTGGASLPIYICIRPLACIQQAERRRCEDRQSQGEEGQSYCVVVISPPSLSADGLQLKAAFPVIRVDSLRFYSPSPRQKYRYTKSIPNMQNPPCALSHTHLHFVHTFTGTWLPSPAATPDESTRAGPSRD